MAGELKAQAARLGIRLGVGPVDNTGPVVAYHDPDDPTNPLRDTLYEHKWPRILDPAQSEAARVVVEEFGGALDLCCWAKGDGDLSWMGKSTWLGPGQYDFSGPDAAYSFALAHGMETFISDPLFSGPPDWLPALSLTPAEHTALIHDFLTAVFERYPLAHATTFFNEMVDKALPSRVGSVPGGGACWWYNRCDAGYPGGQSFGQFAATLTGWVRAANAGIRIAFNIVSNGWEFGSGMGAFMASQVQAFRNVGAIVDAIGFQTHLDGAVKSAAALADFTANLQAVKAAGFEPLVTEFDCPSQNPLAWPSNYYGVVKAALAAGVLRSFNFWRVSDPLYYPEPWWLTGQPYAGAIDTSGAYIESAIQPTAARAAILQALTEATPYRLGLLASPVVDGAVTLTGGRAAGATVSVAAPGASVGAVNYPDSTSWSCVVSSIPPGGTTITATSGAESASVDVQTPEATLAPDVNAIPSPTSDDPIVVSGRVPASLLESDVTATATAAASLTVPKPLSASVSCSASASATLTVPTVQITVTPVLYVVDGAADPVLVTGYVPASGLDLAASIIASATASASLTVLKPLAASLLARVLASLRTDDGKPIATYYARPVPFGILAKPAPHGLAARPLKFGIRRSA